MRLVYTAPRYHTNQHFIAKALLDAGHSVSFLVLRRGASETYEALTPTVLGCSPAFDTLRRLAAKCPGVNFGDTGGLPPPLKFWRAMRRLGPSAVVARDPFSAYGLLAALVTKLIGARPILYIQTPQHRRLKWWKRALLALVRRITGAEWMTPVPGSPGQPAHSLLHYVPFVMPPQTAPDAKHWFAGGVVNVLAIGKWQPRKNHGLFLEAIRRLCQRHAVRATIIGECSTQAHRRELEAVKRHCTRLGLDEVLEFALNLPFSEVQQRYASHDIFVLTSRDEWAAISPLEAMAHSLPVVCSDSNGTQCYLRPGENGFVFRTDDPDDLEACLLRLVSDRERLVAMGHRSYQLVVSEHAPGRYVDTLMALIGTPQ